MKKSKENPKTINLSDWEIVKPDIIEEEKKDKKEKNKIFDEFLDAADWESNDENYYKNKILGEKWIKENKYLDINKFIQNISSFHYFDNHCSNLESKFNKKLYEEISSQPNFYSNPNAKKIIRNGIPPKYMKNILLKLFDIQNVNENNYNKLYPMIFKDHDTKNLDDYVPYFTGKKTLKESLPFHYLNEEGIHELKVLLWMINEMHRNTIIYCPIFIRLISLILIFCDKYETLEILNKLIEQEKNDKEITDIKRRLKFNKNENNKVIDSFFISSGELGNKVRFEFNLKLIELKFNKKKIYEDFYYNIFFNHFNFYGLIRFLPIFLKDGIKSIYKLICSIENEFLEKGMGTSFKNRNEIIPKIRDITKKMNIEEIFNNANNYIFKMNKTEDNEQNTLNENNEFYLPVINGGNLLTDYEIIHLWEMLPNEYKIKNATLIYQAAKNGYNLPNILELEQKYDKITNILFLIETTEGDKFGFINSNLIVHTDNEYQRPTFTMLLTIRPQFKIYSANVESDEILYVTNKDFIFGNGPSGPAIQLNQDIRRGISYGGGCFNNPCLVKDSQGHFVVKKLEIFKLE